VNRRGVVGINPLAASGSSDVTAMTATGSVRWTTCSECGAPSDGAYRCASCAAAAATSPVERTDRQDEPGDDLRAGRLARYMIFPSTARGWIAAGAVAVLIAAVLVSLGASRGTPATPAPGRAVAQKMVAALQAHDATTATALLCSSDPATVQMAKSGLPITHAQLALDGVGFAGSTRRDLVYRVEGVPQVRGLGVDVISPPAGNWCVLMLEINPAGRY
jgi:hypothetical protein